MEVVMESNPPVERCDAPSVAPECKRTICGPTVSTSDRTPWPTEAQDPSSVTEMEEPNRCLKPGEVESVCNQAGTDINTTNLVSCGSNSPSPPMEQTVDSDTGAHVRLAQPKQVVHKTVDIGSQGSQGHDRIALGPINPQVLDLEEKSQGAESGHQEGLGQVKTNTVIDVTDSTQNSVDTKKNSDPTCNTEALSPVNKGPKTDGRPAGSGARKGLRARGNPVDNFSSALSEPVRIQDIARLYGLDALKLEAQAQCEGGDRESRAAQADLAVLNGIGEYLKKQRTTSIKWTGSEFLVTISRIPCRILTIEQQRFEELHRGNHKCSHLYTNYTQGIIYRCPLPECGGATVNQRGIKRSLAAHFKAFHKDLQQIQFTFKIEMARGWDYLSIPEHSASGTLSQPQVPAQNRPATNDDDPGTGQESSGIVIEPPAGGVTRGELVVEEVSTLRQALLGSAASTTKVAQFQGKREKKIRPAEQTGVYCVQEEDNGNRYVCDLGRVFHQGADLRTVQESSDRTGS